MDMNAFAERLSQTADDIAALLGELLGSEPLPGEIARPDRLIAAMRHGVLNGGKRLRPFLLVETASMLGGPRHTAMRAAAALSSAVALPLEPPARIWCIRNSSWHASMVSSSGTWTVSSMRAYCKRSGTMLDPIPGM